MKYDYSNKTKKPTEKKTSSPVTENESPNAKENAANPRQRTDNESNTCALRATVSKCCDLPKTKIPSSSQFLSKIESMVKTSIDKRKNSHTKRIGRTVAPAKMACDLMGALLPAKPEGTRGNHIPRKPGSKPNVKLSSFSRLPVLKKSLVSHGTDKGKEVKSTSETSRLNSKRNDICPESAGTFNESRVVSQSEETRTDPTKQRAKSTELKRNKSDGNALKVVSGRKSAPRDNSHDSARDRIKHLESEPIKRTDCAKTNKEGTKGSVVRHKSKDRDAKTRTSQPRSTDAATVKRTSKEVVDTKKNEADIREEPVGKMPKKKDDINIRDPIPNFDTENLLKVTVQSVDNYDSFMADDRSGNDDFVNLDKKLWGDLELSNTDPSCKTDFSLDNDESLSDIIQQLLIPHSEVEMNEDKFEPNTNFIEDWKTETTKAKKPAPEPIIKEPPAHTKPPQVKFREKSVKPHVESHTHKDVSKTTEKTHHKSSGMTAKRVEDNKLNTHRENTIIGDNTPAFLRDYKNIGFIGKEADEDFVSFDMNQMTLYQPHENQMLVYDLANCIAMQAYLKMCGINYNLAVRKNAEHMSPSGRVPFINFGICIIPEFEAIVSFMQYKKFASVQIGDRDKSAFRSIMAMLMNTMETAEKYICWYDADTLANYTKPRISGNYPFPLNHIIYWKKRMDERRHLAEQGASRKSLRTIIGDLTNCLDILSQRLGNNQFFFGQRGNEVDALVYGHLYAISTLTLNGPFKEVQNTMQQYPNLNSFVTKFGNTVFVGNSSQSKTTK